jgi:hypothetical protein
MGGAKGAPLCASFLISFFPTTLNHAMGSYDSADVDLVVVGGGGAAAFALFKG